MRIPLLMGLLALSSAALAVQDCELNGESVNPANGATTRGKTGLMRCRDRDGGQLVREEELKDGRYQGLVRYYRDGRVEREFSINEKGNKEGVAREFSTADGRLLREETYRNGTAVGVGRGWFADGSLRRIAFRGEDGRETAFAEFNERGQLRDMRCAEKPVLGRDFDDAGLCGFNGATVVPLYAANGKLRARVTHAAGVRTAFESFWDDGKLREQSETADGVTVERSFSVAGIKRLETRWRNLERGRLKELEQEFHESGALTRERRWQGGDLAGEKTFYLNGQPKSESRFEKREGRPVMVVVEYHDNGKSAFQGAFTARNGVRETPLGNQRRFDAEGRLRQERDYDGEGRLTREREYDEGGKPVRDDAVFEDGSRKAYAVPAR